MTAPLHVRVLGAGEGVPVLALHGVTGQGGQWRELSHALPGARMIAVDLRGHGHSPWTPPWHLEQHLADTLAVLDDLGLARVAVAGHSFGAALAVHLAHAAPDRVDRLALLDPAIGLDPRDMLARAVSTYTDGSYPDVASARADHATAWAGVDGALIDTEIAEHLAPDGDRFRLRYCNPAAVVAWSDLARPALTPPPGTPTLVLPAGRAGLVDPGWLDACRAELGDALTVGEIDAGHMLHLERTAAVAALLGPFLGLV
ncbi:MAG: alpha/beta hydrolase [Pseudonocardia sp.]|nr:alpha/beta hydrolase [Pseudonocardia sp.]